MKKYFIPIVILIFTLLSCNTYKRDKFQYRNDDKKVWINTFKSEVFYACIKEGYKNDSLYKIMSNKDLFNLYDGFELNLIDSARILGKNIIIKIPPPYIKIEDNNMLKKNFISYSCLNYYASRELDSIANEVYKIHLKNEKENK